MTEAPIIVIPARLKATRLPDKPLADIHGQPMIVHVWRRAMEAGIGPVLVAAAEPEICWAVEMAGGKAVLTDPDLPSGSDRVHAALEEADPGKKHTIILNLQGDLPAIDPKVIAACLKPLADPEVDIATLLAEIKEEREIADPNVVKVAFSPFADSDIGRALYFSRTPIPSGKGPHWHHIGLYAYRRSVLERFVRLPQGTLEKREKLEQLRALENGMRIDAARVDTVPFGVDTPADLARARALLGKKA
jgi:3-deoxy-manno-octulosonate cytidylyltransferase (CMP-KDO synthetase)